MLGTISSLDMLPRLALVDLTLLDRSVHLENKHLMYNGGAHSTLLMPVSDSVSRTEIDQF